MNRIANIVLALLVVVACGASRVRAVVVPIVNGNFENPLLDETGSPNPVITANNDVPSWIATDAGCVWGKGLAAVRLPDRAVIQVKSVETAS